MLFATLVDDFDRVIAELAANVDEPAPDFGAAPVRLVVPVVDRVLMEDGRPMVAAPALRPLMVRLAMVDGRPDSAELVGRAGTRLLKASSDDVRREPLLSSRCLLLAGA